MKIQNSKLNKLELLFLCLLTSKDTYCTPTLKVLILSGLFFWQFNFLIKCSGEARERSEEKTKSSKEKSSKTK